MKYRQTAHNQAAKLMERNGKGTMAGGLGPVGISRETSPESLDYAVSRREFQWFVL